MDSVFIARQPIVDENQRIYAYELLFRDLSSTSFESESENVRLDDLYTTSRVAVNILNQFGLHRVIGNRKAFINADEIFIMGDFITMLPKDRFVIEILEDVVIDPPLVERVEELRKSGYRFAMDDVKLDADFVEKFGKILPSIDIVKIDIQFNEIGEVRESIETLKLLFPHLTYLAEKVETHEDFRIYNEAGCTLFQGYFFAKPEIKRQKSLDPSKRILIRLTNLLSDEEADVDEIAELFEHAPHLSIQLLQFLNSAYIGLQAPIRSVRHAIVMLGKTHLLNWLYLLSYAGGNMERPEDSPVVALASFRSRLLKKIAKLHRDDGELAEMAAFMGIVSLAEIFFETPLKVLFENLDIDRRIKEALLSRKGIFARYLEIVEAVERFDVENCSRYAESIGLSSQSIRFLVMDSYSDVDRRMGEE